MRAHGPLLPALRQPDTMGRRPLSSLRIAGGVVNVRGVDPGSHSIAWCDLDAGDGGPAAFVGMGAVAASEFMSLVPVDPSQWVVAIERAYGLRIGARPNIQQIKATVTDLLLTNWIACRIVEACCRAGVRVFEIDQAVARRGIGVQSTKPNYGEAIDLNADQQIAIIVPELVRGWPSGKKASNSHKRDAAVYGLQGAHLLSVEAGLRYDADEKARAEERERQRNFMPQSPGTYGPGDHGPDSFGGSDY